MKKRTLAVAALVAGTVAAAAAYAYQAHLSPLAQARGIVRASLLDPESAKFEQDKLDPQTGGYCGAVNAKNRMGGYAGPRLFYLAKGRAAPEFAPDDNKTGSIEEQIRSTEKLINFLERLQNICPGA